MGDVSHNAVRHLDFYGRKLSRDAPMWEETELQSQCWCGTVVIECDPGRGLWLKQLQAPIASSRPLDAMI